jgi:prepilin-type N-terminal cleavage/methylation domain-containing protein
MRTDRLRAAPVAGARTHARGFSLVELLMAIVILSVILMGLAGTTVSYLHEVTQDNVRVQAAAAADERIASIRAYPIYDSLTVRFAGTESNWPGYQGWTRSTVVTRNAGAVDVTKVTVSVDGPGLLSPIARSISIGVP